MKDYKFFGRKQNDMQLTITDPRLIKLAVQAENMAFALWDTDQMLRNEYKYNDNEPAYQIRDIFHNVLDRHGLDLDDLLE